MNDNTLNLRPDNIHKPAGGRLLVSEPFLPDPYFRRTVIVLCEHNAEGSFGFVLNRHTDMAVDQLIEKMPHVTSKVGIGGPVQSNDLFYLHTLGAHLAGSTEIVDGVFMGGDIDQLREILTADKKLGKHVRFFVGYSGWTEGQLEKELEEKAWFISLADKKRIMHIGKNDIWSDTLKGMGPRFAPLANFPEDPGLN